MSCIFVIVPVVAVGWPVVCSMASVAAGAMGLRALGKSAACAAEASHQTEDSGVEIEDENSRLGMDSIGENENMVFEREGLRITIRRDHRGRLKIHVEGEGKSRQELQAQGRKFMSQLRKQFAYQKVMEELRKKGFTTVKEESVEGRIKVRMRKIS